MFGCWSGVLLFRRDKGERGRNLWQRDILYLNHTVTAFVYKQTDSATFCFFVKLLVGKHLNLGPSVYYLILNGGRNLGIIDLPPNTAKKNTALGKKNRFTNSIDCTSTLP